MRNSKYDFANPLFLFEFFDTKNVFLRRVRQKQTIVLARKRFAQIEKSSRERIHIFVYFNSVYDITFSALKSSRPSSVNYHTELRGFVIFFSFFFQFYPSGTFTPSWIVSEDLSWVWKIRIIVVLKGSAIKRDADRCAFVSAKKYIYFKRKSFKFFRENIRK